MNKERLQELIENIQNNTATSSDKKEYMTMLYENGSISQKQYDSYLKGERTEDLLKVGIAVGSAILLAWSLEGLFANNELIVKKNTDFI